MVWQILMFWNTTFKHVDLIKLNLILRVMIQAYFRVRDYNLFDWWIENMKPWKLHECVQQTNQNSKSN